MQIYFVDLFLGGEFTTYGSDVSVIVIIIIIISVIIIVTIIIIRIILLRVILCSNSINILIIITDLLSL